MNKQRGFVGIIISLVILSSTAFFMEMYFSIEKEKNISLRVDKAGRHLQEISFSVMRYISEQGLAATPGVYSGSEWLKGASCGGAAPEEYLPNCAFRDANDYGDEYETTISVAGGVVTAVIRLDFPFENGEISPVSAARIKKVAASYLSGSTPVSQTFADYSLDVGNQQILATINTASSTDIWYRTDGSNQMNANANFGGFSMYNVSAIYGSDGATEDIDTQISVGSALNVAGVLTIDSGASNGDSNSGHLVVNTFNDTGHSVVAVGGLEAAFLDSYGAIIVGDGSGTTSNARVLFNQNGTDSDPYIESTSAGDLEVRNSNGNATLIADRIYTESVNRFSDQALYDLTIAQNGDLIPKPSCRSGLTPQIFTAIKGLASNPSRPINSFDVVPVSINSTYWQIDVRLKTDGPGLVADSFLESRVLVAVKCS